MISNSLLELLQKENADLRRELAETQAINAEMY